MSWESISHLLLDEDQPFPLVISSVVLGAAILVTCLVWPCLRGSLDEEDVPSGTGTKVQVTSLYVYPVKSCAGHSVTVAQVGKRGFDFDRQWMMINARGRFVTQRQDPRLALIRPSLPTHQDEALRLNAPGMQEETVPVVREADGGKVVEVDVWGSPVQGVDQGDGVGAWLSKYLEQDGVRLLRMRDCFTRPTNPKRGKGETGFADGYPILLASEESLEDLNSRLKEPVPMNRFRPNIVVKGCTPFEEDQWTLLRLGGMTLRFAKPCDRCQVPTIEQTTGKPHKTEPTATLQAFRSGTQLGFEGGDKAVYFGQNVIHTGMGTLQVGDQGEVLRIRKPGPKPKDA